MASPVIFYRDVIWGMPRTLVAPVAAILCWWYFYEFVVVDVFGGTATEKGFVGGTVVIIHIFAGLMGIILGTFYAEEKNAGTDIFSF